MSSDNFHNVIGGQVNSFDQRSSKSQLSSFTFQSNFLHYRARGMSFPSSCFIRQDALKHLHDDLERSIENLTWVQGHVVTRVESNGS